MYKRRKLRNLPSEENEDKEVCSKSGQSEKKIENVTDQQVGIIVNKKNADHLLEANQHSGELLIENMDSVSSRKKMMKVFDQMSGPNPKQFCIFKRADIPLDFIIKKRLNFVSKHDTKNVCQILSDHCSQILTKIIHSGIHHMHQCGRTTFTVADFNKGLLSSGEKFDKYVDNFYECVNKSSEQPHILKFEGKWLNNNNPLSIGVCDLPVEQQNYFNEITKVLLTETEESCGIIWKDLRTNNCILHLVPYFVSFVSNCIDKFSNDLVRMPLFLKTICSLLYNPYLYFENGYLNLLALTLLKFLLKELPCLNGIKDCFLLKDSAANLLGKILKKSKSRKLLFEIIENIECIFSGNIQSLFVSQYGALAALNSIGVPSILLVFSHFDKFYEYLYKYFINTPISCHRRNDICMVLSQLIHSHYLLMHHYFKYEILDFNLRRETYYFPDFSKIKVFPVLLLSNFNEYFGDCLVPHFPLLNFVSYNVYLKKAKVKNTTNTKRKTQKSNLKSSTNGKNCSKVEISYKVDEIFDFIPLKNRTIKFRKINRILVES